MSQGQPPELFPSPVVVQRVAVIALVGVERHRDPQLMLPAFAQHVTGGLASPLDRREQQRDEQCDNRNHDQKFDERKPV